MTGSTLPHEYENQDSFATSSYKLTFFIFEASQKMGF